MNENDPIPNVGNADEDPDVTYIAPEGQLTDAPTFTAPSRKALQRLIWTPLPQGIVKQTNGTPSSVQVSVLVSPQLFFEETIGYRTESSTELETFTDWVNWPDTVLNQSTPLSFSVYLDGQKVADLPAPTSGIKPEYWAAMFGPTTTRVDNFGFHDFSQKSTTTFSAISAHDAITDNVYKPYAGGAATAILTGGVAATPQPVAIKPDLTENISDVPGASLPQPTPGGGSKKVQIHPISTNPTLTLVETASIAAKTFDTVYNNKIPGFSQAITFHTPPANDTPLPPPTVPILDFHQAISSLGSHPELLENFGLLFRLEVPLSSRLGNTTEFAITVIPHWKPSVSNFFKTVNVPMTTNCSLGADHFISRPSTDPTGAPYLNGSLNLGLTDSQGDLTFRFVDLDVDRAIQSLNGLNANVTSTHLLQAQTQPITINYNLPGLRSSGPSLFWKDFGVQNGQPGGDAGLSALSARQKQMNDNIETWTNSAAARAIPLVPSSLLELYTEDITRGWRFDVLDTTKDVGRSNGYWHSLHWHKGDYILGAAEGAQIEFSTPTASEGIVSPSAAHAPTDDVSNITSLYVHEMIMKWNGWSLSAPRPSNTAQDDGSIVDTVKNPMVPTSYTDEYGNHNPQMSASFRIPDQVVDVTDPVTNEKVGDTGLPVLRYGHAYKLSARLVDLGGWSILQGRGIPSPNVVPHERWDPVKSPIVVPTAPLTQGEGAHTVVLRDDNSVSNEAGFAATKHNGRWLFPPRVHERLAQEHGELDTAAGLPDVNKYGIIRSYADGSLSTLGTEVGGVGTATGSGAGTNTPNIVLLTNLADGTVNGGVPVVTWLPDPASHGYALNIEPPPGYKVNPGGPLSIEPFMEFNTDVKHLGSPLPVFVDAWNFQGDAWPYAEGKLLRIQPTEVSSDDVLPYGVVRPIFKSNEKLTASPTAITIKVVPGSVYEFRLSSIFPAEYATIAPNPTFALLPSVVDAFQQAGVADVDMQLQSLLEGQVPEITPARTLRIVYAVLRPLVGPHFSDDVTFIRTGNSTKVAISDANYKIDLATTESVNYVATWTDHIDDPTDPSNDPATTTSQVTEGSIGLTVANVYAPAVDNDPLVPTLPTPGPSSVPLGTIDEFHALSVEHRIGDTKHHHVTYTATGTSRFGRFFEETVSLTLTGGTPSLIDARGVDPNHISVKVASTGEIVDPENYTLTAATGTIELNVPPRVRGGRGFVEVAPALSGVALTVLYVPTDTTTGEAFEVHIPSTTPPPPIKVVRVAPAWNLSTTPLADGSGHSYRRIGNTLRVYMERPWYVTGNNEMVGVLAAHYGSNDQLTGAVPTTVSLQDITLVALDPISVPGPVKGYSQTQLSFITPDQVPESGGTITGSYKIPGGNPVKVPSSLVPTYENYNVFGFEPQYDSASDNWYVDIQLDMNKFTDHPPPGYFVRLALARFQPYSISEAPVTTDGVTTYPHANYLSPVTLVTIAQPVSDRTVTVSNQSGELHIAVTGPGYFGWRPAPDNPTEPWDHDDLNLYAKHPNSDGSGQPTTSTMMVDIQEYTQPNGFTGDFGWTNVGDSVPLQATFANSPIVSWATTSDHPVKVPSTDNELRVRISELDYHGLEQEGAPSSVDSRFRRSFVAHIPVGITVSPLTGPPNKGVVAPPAVKP